MAGARLRPLNFSDSGYAMAAQLLARSGEVTGAALAGVGQDIKGGLNTITTKKEVKKQRVFRANENALDRALRSDIANKSLLLRAKEGASVEARIRASEASRNGRALAGLLGRNASVSSSASEQYTLLAVDAADRGDEQGAQKFAELAQEAKQKANDQSTRASSIIQQLMASPATPSVSPTTTGPRTGKT